MGGKGHQCAYSDKDRENTGKTGADCVPVKQEKQQEGRKENQIHVQPGDQAEKCRKGGVGDPDSQTEHSGPDRREFQLALHRKIAQQGRREKNQKLRKKHKICFQIHSQALRYLFFCF